MKRDKNGRLKKNPKFEIEFPSPLFQNERGEGGSPPFGGGEYFLRKGGYPPFCRKWR